MDVVEIRDLDGPNLFRMEPVIKLELAFNERDDRAETLDAIADRIGALHRELGLPAPEVTRHRVDAPDRSVLAFNWEWRATAVGIARAAADLASWPVDDVVLGHLRERLARDRAEGDRPRWIRDDERTKPAVGITGTNGKTTTTRLLAHIVARSGKRVGWSSSTGVYIAGRQVLEGDYSGPSGARRVLDDPDVEVAILETARGGLLLRGMACESNDVGVFLNISADHLSMYGVETMETLAEVKSVVVRATRPDGLVVLNADDPLVASYRDRVRAPVMFFSQRPGDAILLRHIESGGAALICEGDCLQLYRDGDSTPLARLSDIPMTYGGAAPFMVENAMGAAAAALGLGLAPEQVADGLASFRNDAHSNPGRLNVFSVEGRSLVIDYAHNDIGLAGLATFARRLADDDCRVHLVVGTAGDRRDDDFRALGRLARDVGDVVYLKDTRAYMRGRAEGEMPALMREGFESGDGDAVLAGEFDDEYSAVLAALDASTAGDVIAVMCQMDQERIVGEIERRGGGERVPNA